MKKITTNTVLAIALTLSALTAGSQNISNYTFASSSGTFTALGSQAIKPPLSGNTNDGYSNSIPIGFDFWYMGNRYTHAGISTNGWLALGLSSTSVSNAVPVNSFSAVNSVPKPFVAPLWDDLDFTQSGGGPGYFTTGTAPNRIFTAEWLNAEWELGADVSVISFQVKLFESSGKIEFIYRQEGGSVAAGSASIGIEGSSELIYQSLNGTGVTPGSSTSVSTNTLSTRPATAQVYSFTPPSPSAPSSLTFSGVGLNSMTLNWTDNASNEIGYAVYRSTDSIYYTFQTLTAANATSTTIASLTPSTRYYYKVYAVTEGGTGSAFSGSQLTSTGSITGGVLTIPGSYASITAAVAALASNGFVNSTILELQSSYTSTVETFPIVFPASLGTSPSKTLTVRPASGVTNLTITAAAAANGIINLSGCRYVIFDGRPGGTGSTKALTIDKQSGNGGAVVFLNDASYNTVRYCTLKGYGSGPTIVEFKTTNAQTGNDNNTIEYNNITAGHPSGVMRAITSSGTAGMANSNNIISNNNIYDHWGTGVLAPSHSIWLQNYSENFLITGNHIYNSQAISMGSSGGSMYGIMVSGELASASITNNYIGGSAPYCGGTPWSVSSTANYMLCGIEVDGATSLLSSEIRNNTIANYAWTGSASAFVSIIGIQLIGSSATVAENIIGPSTTVSGINSIVSTVSANVTNYILKNTIRGMSSTGSAGAIPVNGISLLGNGSHTVEGNIITGLSAAAPTGMINGILVNSGVATLQNNMMQLGLDAAGTSVTTPCAIIGIKRLGTHNATIKHNSVFIGGSGVATGTANSACVSKAGTGVDTTILFNNIFYNGRTNATTGGAHYTTSTSGSGNVSCNYNLYYTGTPGVNNALGGLAGASSIIADPRFINPTGNSTTVDLHLNPVYASPCEAYGSAIYTTTTDFDGQTRSSFSPVDIGADAGNFTQLTLPVKWLSFDGKAENKNVLLNWSTASETNNSYFQVERSLTNVTAGTVGAGAAWTVVGKVQGNGTATTISKYNITDNLSNLQLPSSNVYYRLKQVDVDGKFEYSKVISVALGTPKKTVVITPNPTKGWMKLQIPEASDSKEVTVKDLQGKTVWSGKIATGQTDVDVDLNDLEKGIYFVTVIGNDGTSVTNKVAKE